MADLHSIVATHRVTVGPAPVLVQTSRGQSEQDVALHIRPESGDSVLFGGEDVDTSNGLEFSPGDRFSFTMLGACDLYAMTTSGGSAVVSILVVEPI